MNSPLLSSGATPRAFGEAGPALSERVRRDQLVALRRSVSIALPINVLLGAACWLMASHHGLGRVATVWFLASSLVNLVRITVCRWSLPAFPENPRPRNGKPHAWMPSVTGHLRLHAVTAWLSGTVWAWVPALCAGYTHPEAIFFLAVVCGITAGSVTHGTACALIPTCFIIPPLASVVGCLVYVGGFDHDCLAAAAALYLAALLRSARQNEAAFRESSERKNEATALAESLDRSHAHSLQVSDRMRDLAWHDGLTGILNRTGFMQETQQRLHAHPHKHFCFMLLDLDGFKAVNDAFGHHAGDQVLIKVARRLRAAVPDSALLGRLGGDKFAILHDPDALQEAPTALASRLISVVPFSIFDGGRLGASIGVHHAAEVALTDRLAYADEALHAAKSAGRNQFRLFDAALLVRLEMRRDIERDLPAALNAGSLEVWFQPIFKKGGRDLESLEALLRWNHAAHGWVPPPEMIFTAAVTGMSETLTRYILARVCAMIRDLKDAGHAHVRVAMNLSPLEMAQADIERIVPQTLARLGVPADLLEIEITEETAMDVHAVQGKLAALGAAGIRIAIDDFGVGFSSLASLRHRQVQRVKIDRSFVSGLTATPDNRVLVEAVLNLGRSLDIDIVAEGVESAEDLHILRGLGCENMQGYYLARPMPAAAVMTWIANRAG
ncbi:EAL domain-containing protein [Robbsia sp. Bb-Pol-6]|uniref:EAL domain-containing protein n=1 Tax=Robbsia betulipollinis TaxID=2981849 RepID=A0ABT3ZJL9_9BURK|nr:EAL domain-containing protein [Robbsia betulipollinis]MCY0386721.1 EAL domain-containing protein [Robbsia betulipollinis]